MSMSLQTSYGSTPAIGYAGMLSSEDVEILTLKNVEASASIPFGTAVCWKTSSPATDADALLPATNSDLVAGIVVHSHAYARTWTSSDGTVYGDLDSTGLVPNTMMSVLRRGKILVVCATACAPGDRLYVRADIGEASETFGSLANAADESDMIDCTKQGQWLTTALAGGLAWLEVDFTNKP